MGLLRVALALCVVIWHSPIRTGGYLPMNAGYAVQCFFVISGFYMALILTEKYKDRMLFYSNRALRLLPLYLVVAVLTLVFYLTTRTPHAWLTSTEMLNPLSMLMLVITNLTMLGQDLLMFLGIDYHTGWFYFTSNFYQEPLPAYKFLLVPQAWTVGLELLFYVFAPWLVVLRGRWLALVIVGSLAVRFGLAGVGLAADPWTYRFFPSELVFFVAGIVAYRAYRLLRERQYRLPTWAGWAIVATMLGLIAVHYYLPATLHSRFLPPMITALVIPFAFLATGRNRIDRYIGELSYAIYITHILARLILDHFLPGVSSLAMLALTIPMAILLQWVVEQPFNRLRQRRATGAQAGTNRSLLPRLVTTKL